MTTRFSVLGPLAVERDGSPVPVGAPKQRVLLAALLLAPGRPMSTERLVDEIWPDDPPPTAGTALQVYVSGLRKLLGGVLRSVAPGYQLDVDPDDVDAHRFEAMLAEARTWREDHPARASARLGEALALWTGPAFDGTGGGSAIAAAAARLDQQRRTARLDWATLELALGRHRQIVAELSGWAAEHPTDEGLARQYMLALHRCGRSGEALAEYDRLRDMLDTALRVEPEEETIALAKAIRQRDPTIEAVLPNLPVPVSRFVGRRHDLDRAATLLGRHRLLTVTGPGGCGKTRFAAELAREVAPAHPDGIHLVELAGAPGPDEPASKVGPDVAERAVGAVGARESAGQDSLAALVQHFGAARHLLVVDNCEHVLGAAAELVGALLAACPGLRIVATSREPLGLPGEPVISLHGLDLPAPGATLAEAVRSDAVRLFLDRADAARGGTRLRREEEPAAVELCRRLDGLPLAIELAAARLRAFAVPDLLERLPGRLHLLSGTAGPDRHRTILAAIAWSHDLLDGPERALFAQLSVFVGGFTLAAAERVAADDGVPTTLARLVERSMVARDADSTGSGSGRYRMIETIREYASDRLVDPRGPRDRHAAWCADLVAAPPPVDGPAHADWLATMNAEHDNLRAALEWTLDTDPPRGLAIAASSLWWYWWVTGQMAEGRAWLDRALAADTTVSPTRGKALRAAAALARNSGDLDDARRLGDECLRTFRELDDTPGVIAALNNLSITAQGQADFDASLEYGYAGLTLAEQAGNERAVAAALNNTGGTLRCLDRLDEAREMFTRALDLFRGFGDRRAQAAATGNLSIVARRQGRFDDARQLALRTLVIYDELRIDEGVLDALEAYAAVDAQTGEPERALRLLRVAARERERLSAPIFTPDEKHDRDRAERLALAALGQAAPGTEPEVVTLQQAVSELRDLI